MDLIFTKSTKEHYYLFPLLLLPCNLLEITPKSPKLKRTFLETGQTTTTGEAANGSTNCQPFTKGHRPQPSKKPTLCCSYKKGMAKIASKLNLKCKSTKKKSVLNTKIAISIPNSHLQRKKDVCLLFFLNWIHCNL